MTFTHLGILLTLGGLHSASLWAVTLAAKRAGLRGNLLRLVPIALGVPSAWYAFPLALHLVTGQDIQTHIGAGLGVVAAAGAEVCYRTLARYAPQLTERLLGQLGGGIDERNHE